MKRSLLIAAVALAGAACSGSSGDPVSDPKPVDPGVATVTFRVNFPARTDAVKTLLDPLAQTVEISWYSPGGMNNGMVSVTRANPSATAVIPVGSYTFEATALDAMYMPLETAGTAGKLIAGENSVVMTFLDGRWDLTAPIELSDGTLLDGFYLSHYVDPMAPVAIDPNAPLLRSIYDTTWIVNAGTAEEAYLATQASVGTQFGGGFANRSYLDGAGFNLDSGCGEFYEGDNPNPACLNGGPGAGVNFRIIGNLESGGGGDDAARALLPPGSFDPPSVNDLADTVIESGVTISGHILEYTPSATQPTPAIVEGLTGAAVAPIAKAVQTPPESAGTLTVTENRGVVLCRDDYNRPDIGTTIQYGTWDFHEWNWDPGTMTYTQGRDCRVDITGDGIWDYSECGSPNPPNFMGTVDAGECSYGLVPANPSDLGEVCECYDRNMGYCYGSYPMCGDGIISPWEFGDLNYDGVVDLGSFYFKHYVSSGFTLDYFAYPFTATGTAVAPTTELTVQ